MKTRCFIDTDVFIDILVERHPFYPYAAELFSLADQNQLNLFTTSLSIANLYYNLSKHVGSNNAKSAIKELRNMVGILKVDEKIIDDALFSNFKDFEDAVQYHAAIDNKISIIITRNLKDFRHSIIPVMTPEEYLKSL